MKKYIVALSVLATFCFAGIGAAEPVHINMNHDQGIVSLARSSSATWRCRKCGRTLYGTTRYPGSGYYCTEDGGSCIFDRVG